MWGREGGGNEADVGVGRGWGGGGERDLSDVDMCVWVSLCVGVCGCVWACLGVWAWAPRLRNTRETLIQMHPAWGILRRR